MHTVHRGPARFWLTAATSNLQPLDRPPGAHRSEVKLSRVVVQAESTNRSWFVFVHPLQMDERLMNGENHDMSSGACDEALAQLDRDWQKTVSICVSSPVYTAFETALG